MTLRGNAISSSALSRLTLSVSRTALARLAFSSKVRAETQRVRVHVELCTSTSLL
jgi:hypothetical protein